MKHIKLKLIETVFLVSVVAVAGYGIFVWKQPVSVDPPYTVVEQGVVAQGRAYTADDPERPSETPSSHEASVNVEKQEMPQVPVSQDHFGAYDEVITSDGFIVSGGIKYPQRKYTVSALPSDPSAGQWWVSSTGLPEAWNYNTGSGTKIAVLDTGFGLAHQELTGKWLDNAGEIGPTIQEAAAPKNCTARGKVLDKSCNGIDDDNNGFIDDSRGWDFDSNDESVAAGEVNPVGDGVSHGTSVAGVAAGSANNGVGIAGVSWGAKVLPLQVLDDNGDGYTLSIARAIRYATDRDVDVINLSLGSDDEDPYVRLAIQYALERGVIVVAAAGNDGCNCISYPARYPEVVAVGAYQSNGSPASFSSYGSTLDIMAPGAQITAPRWSSVNTTTGYASNIAGTSFAAPYISGLLANGRSNQPEASWGQLVNLLTQTADHRGVTEYSAATGFGFVKADSFIRRTALPYSLNQPVQYKLSTSFSDALSMSSVNVCQESEFASTPFYELRLGSSVSYSASELAAYLNQKYGGISTKRSYVCSGLPSDGAVNLRLINSPAEFSNYNVRK